MRPPTPFVGKEELMSYFRTSVEPVMKPLLVKIAKERPADVAAFVHDYASELMAYPRKPGVATTPEGIFAEIDADGDGQLTRVRPNGSDLSTAYMAREFFAK